MDAARKVERTPGVRAMKPQQIREAAARLFMAQGYGAVSMDAIAREAGVSKATIYAHFADKAELFADLMTGECARQWPEIVHFDSAPPDLRAALLAVAQAYAEFLVAPKVVQVFRMVVAEAPRFPELGRAFYEGGPRLITDRLAAYLARMAKAGRLEIEDPAMAAQHFLAMLRGEHHLRALLGLDETVDRAALARFAEAATDLFLKAYGPRKAAEDAAG